MPTVTRMPRTQGLPPITAGFLVMRPSTIALNCTPAERPNSSDECLRLVKIAGERRPEHGVRRHQFNNWPEWIMLACHTGLRPGEQSTLEFSDIDLVHGFLTIRRKPHFHFHPKNYQLRRVPLSDPARMAIEKMVELEHSASDLVFHRVDGSRWGNIAGSFDSLVDRAGLQRSHPTT